MSIGGNNSAETHVFELDVKAEGLEAGKYRALILFPEQENETSVQNNRYDDSMVFEIYRSDPFDVWVTGKADPITGNSLDILATVAHNGLETIDGDLWVTVNGITQKLNYVMAHHNTKISDESKWLHFDVSGWNPGTYEVTLDFPPRNNEPNTINNKYTFEVTIPVKPKTEKIDLSLSGFAIMYHDVYPGEFGGTTDKWYDAGGMLNRNRIFYVDYTIVSGASVTDSNGQLVIKADDVVLFQQSVTVKGGQSVSDMIPISGLTLPPDGGQHLISGEIVAQAKEDINPNNNRKGRYVYIGK